MANDNMTGSGNSGGGGSIWPVVTIIIGVIALALAGWDAVLASHNRQLEGRVKNLENRLSEIDNKGKQADAAAAAARKRARAAAAATNGGGGGGDAKVKAPEKGPAGDKATPGTNGK